MQLNDIKAEIKQPRPTISRASPCLRDLCLDAVELHLREPDLKVQQGEVRPAQVWYYGRYGYHVCLLLMLIVATGTDLRNYTIADALIVTG